MFAKPKYVATTPKNITPSIVDFCKSIEPEYQPTWLSLRKEATGPIGQCYWNVEAYIDDYGGEIQYGWAIWEQDSLYLTAEHHAVVKKDGELIEATSQRDDERVILSLPSDLAWKGQTIFNRYAPVKDTPLARRVCELQSMNVFEVMTKGLTLLVIRNDQECTNLIDRFYAVKNRREYEKRRRSAQKRKRAA